MMTYQFSSEYLANSLLPALNSAALATELGGNTAAITKFSYAGGSSTYSFGLYQFDVGNNSAARNFLSQLGFSATQISQLSQHGGLTVSQVNSLDTQLQTALSSPDNAVKLQLFTDAWAAGLAAQLQTVLNTVAASGAAGQAIADQIYASTALQVQLMDYSNQFHLDLNGSMVQWLEGKSVSLTGGTFKLAAGATLTSSMIRSFVMATQYGVSHASAETTRESALFTVLNTLPAGQAASTPDTSQSPLVNDSNMPTIIVTPTSCTVVNEAGLNLTDADLAALKASCSQSAAGAASPQGTQDGTAATATTADGGNLSSAPDDGDPTAGGSGDPSGGGSGDGGDGGGGGGAGDDNHAPVEEESIGPRTSIRTIKLGGASSRQLTGTPDLTALTTPASGALLTPTSGSVSQLVQAMASFGSAPGFSTMAQEPIAGAHPGPVSLLSVSHVTRLAA